MRAIVVSISFMLLLLNGLAFSQQGREAGENANTRVDKQDAAAWRAAAEQKRQKELDAQYKAATDRMKTPNATSDPWGEVRPVKTPNNAGR
jgi:hypothetical protein